jgi:hypothetical protein
MRKLLAIITLILPILMVYINHSIANEHHGNFGPPKMISGDSYRISIYFDSPSLFCHTYSKVDEMAKEHCNRYNKGFAYLGKCKKGQGGFPWEGQVHEISCVPKAAEFKKIEAINLVERNGLIYERFINSPFTGQTIGKEQYSYENGKLHGPFVIYHDNGQLKSQGNYVNGEMGTELLYDQKGVIIPEKSLSDSWSSSLSKCKESFLTKETSSELNIKEFDNWNNCQGTYTFSDGNKYAGEWKDGNFHGQGTYKWTDGQKYVGEFKDGQRHGQGANTWPNGEGYVGVWKDNKKHGQGTLTFPDGTKYYGEWKDDKQHGQGTITFPDGAKHVGEFKDDQINGQGTFIWPDGKEDEGIWKDNRLITEKIISLKKSDPVLTKTDKPVVCFLFCENKNGKLGDK